MNKKNILIIILAIALGISLVYTFINRDYSQIMAVTGATPLAINRDVPSGFTLTVNGLTKKEYRFNAKALNAFAKTRIRTREVNTNGKFVGTYIYQGIPLYNILEGIAPQKPDKSSFDRPLDMIVKVISSNGNMALFSYGELTMVDDSRPVTLAYHRSELLPSKDPEKYTKNTPKDTLEALSIICPGDSDTSRYLDNVTAVRLELLPAPDNKLPVMQKGIKCTSPFITCLYNNKGLKTSYRDLKKVRVQNWIRVGHGRGYKGISKAQGHSLRDFLQRNFPHCNRNSFFLMTACDGYRCLFSGYEIFDNEQGEDMIIMTMMDGKKPHGGYILAPVKDYFVDRNVWGLSHIVFLEKNK